jgi:hypothetical protein
MNKEIVDFTESQLREVFAKAGLKAEDIDKGVIDYIRFRESELSSLSLLSYKDLQTIDGIDFYKTLRGGKEILKNIILSYSAYISEKREIAETYQESKSWDKVITTAVYSDSYSSQEAFIDYVEEIYNTKIKDAKQLQKLTGITEETLEGLEDTLLNSRSQKYERAIETAIENGAKYKDLLKIDPKVFSLPETNKEKAILKGIAMEFLLIENLVIHPDLRDIAEELEAPYSVILEAKNRVSFKEL